MSKKTNELKTKIKRLHFDDFNELAEWFEKQKQK